MDSSVHDSIQGLGFKVNHLGHGRHRLNMTTPLKNLIRKHFGHISPELHCLYVVLESAKNRLVVTNDFDYKRKQSEDNVLEYACFSGSKYLRRYVNNDGKYKVIATTIASQATCVYVYNIAKVSLSHIVRLKPCVDKPEPRIYLVLDLLDKPE